MFVSDNGAKDENRDQRVAAVLINCGVVNKMLTWLDSIENEVTILPQKFANSNSYSTANHG